MYKGLVEKMVIAGGALGLLMLCFRSVRLIAALPVIISASKESVSQKKSS